MINLKSKRKLYNDKYENANLNSFNQKSKLIFMQSVYIWYNLSEYQLVM